MGKKLAFIFGFLALVIGAKLAEGKLNDILRESDEEFQKIHERYEAEGPDYTDKEARKDRNAVYICAGVKILKLYTPVIKVSVACVAGAYCAGRVLEAANKMNTIADKLGYSVDELAHTPKIDISSAVVKESIREAAEKKASYIADQVSEHVLESARRDVSRRVQSAVDRAYPGIKESIAKELHRQLPKVDIDDVKAEVVEAAKRFKESLNDVLNNFNDKLKNVAKIYSSIADTLRDKA